MRNLNCHFEGSTNGMGGLMLRKGRENAQERGVDTQGGGGKCLGKDGKILGKDGKILEKRNGKCGKWMANVESGWQMPSKGGSPGMPGGSTGNKTRLSGCIFLVRYKQLCLFY